MNTENIDHGESGQQRQIAAIRKIILPRLKELGVAKLTIHYDGCGDEGRLGDIVLEPENASLPSKLEDQLRELVDAFLYEEHGSWCDGEGATGTVVLDVAESRIVNGHGEYVSDVEYSTLTF